MAKRPHYITVVAEKLRAEILASAERVAANLAPPAEAADGTEIKRAEFISWWREQSYANPTFMRDELDRLAPQAIPLPGSEPLRAETGLKNYIAIVKEARPDIWRWVMRSETEWATMRGEGV